MFSHEGLAAAGRVMLAALRITAGIGLILGSLSYDIASVPRRSLHLLLARAEPGGAR